MNYLLALLAITTSYCLLVAVHAGNTEHHSSQKKSRGDPVASNPKPLPPKPPPPKPPPPTSEASGEEEGMVNPWESPSSDGPSYGPPGGPPYSPPGGPPGGSSGGQMGSGMSANSHSAECENCPPNTLLALFIFSRMMTASKFNSVKDTWTTVYGSCLPDDTRVGYISAKDKKTSSVNWADNSTFQAMLNKLKVADFQLEESLSDHDFASIIEQALKKASEGLPPNPDSSTPVARKILLIVTDFDLYISKSGADDIVKDLKLDYYHIKYLWVATGNESLPNNTYINNLDVISDPGKYPTYVNNWSELNSPDVIDELAYCFNHPESSFYQQMITARSTKGSNEWVPFVATAAGILIVVVIVGVLCVVYNNSKLNYKAKMARYRAEIRNNQVVPNHYQDLERRDEWTIPRERLQVNYDLKLGAGAFCNVFKGKLSGTAPVCIIYPSIQASRSYTDCEVAVKILPTFADDMAKSDFVQEINFMKSLAYHPHLICMLGMVWEKLDEPRLVTEYCSRGDLLHYIREKKEEIVNGYANTNGLKLKDLLSYSWQISDGMDYLSSKGCIHRDLAARNVLLDYTNTAKIGDFGLCRMTDRSLYTTRGGRLPIKWMAIESLKSYEYSFKSDVWSFGVMLFELFSLGDVPFPRVQPADMIDHLDTGARLHQPPFCPNEIYAIMIRCWLVEPRSRPSFEIVRTEITKILERATENYGYLPVENAEYVSEVDMQNAFNIARELQTHNEHSADSIAIERSVDPSFVNGIIDID